MSAYSTLYLSRDEVINYIHSHLYDLSNEDLGKIIDIWLEKRLYNARVRDGKQNDDDVLYY